MSLDRIGRLCGSVLPAEFERIRRQLPAIQQFLEANLPEPVNRSVTLLTINRDEIVIAANSPLVANYLRLHGREIQQQLRETFDLEQSLKFRTIPDSMLKLEQADKLRTPRKVSAESIDALERHSGPRCGIFRTTRTSARGWPVRGGTSPRLRPSSCFDLRAGGTTAPRSKRASIACSRFLG